MPPKKLKTSVATHAASKASKETLSEEQVTSMSIADNASVSIEHKNDDSQQPSVEEPKKSTVSKRGRPAKPKAVEASNPTDLDQAGPSQGEESTNKKELAKTLTKRGRPPKAKTEQSGETRADQTANVEEVATDKAPAKQVRTTKSKAVEPGSEEETSKKVSRVNKNVKSEEDSSMPAEEITDVHATEDPAKSTTKKTAAKRRKAMEKSTEADEGTSAAAASDDLPKKRGRPKKAEAITTTEEDPTSKDVKPITQAEKDAPKTKRGRPKKNEVVEPEQTKDEGTIGDAADAADVKAPKKSRVAKKQATEPSTTGPLIEGKSADGQQAKAPIKRGRPKKLKDEETHTDNKEASEAIVQEEQDLEKTKATKRGRPKKSDKEDPKTEVENPIASDNEASSKTANQEQQDPPKKSTNSRKGRKKKDDDEPSADSVTKRGRKRKQNVDEGGTTKATESATTATPSSPENKTAELQGKSNSRTKRQKEDMVEAINPVESGNQPKMQNNMSNSSQTTASSPRGKKRKQKQDDSEGAKEGSSQNTSEGTSGEQQKQQQHQANGLQENDGRSSPKKQKPDSKNPAEKHKGPKAYKEKELKFDQVSKTRVSNTDDGVSVEQDVIMAEQGADANPEQPEVSMEKDVSQTQIEGFDARKAKLSELRRRKDESAQENRKALQAEHARSKVNPKAETKRERQRQEAEQLLAQQEAEKKGEDWERKKYWEYSAESVEKWEQKEQKKAERSDIAFTDYNQVAQKKYERMINDFKPNLAAYNEQKAIAMASASLVPTQDGEYVQIDADSNFFRDANSLSYANVDVTPSREAVDRVVNDVNKQIARREQYSRQRPIKDDDDITYINERNRRFNEKIGRFYDPYTKEIKENFERGTAL